MATYLFIQLSELEEHEMNEIVQGSSRQYRIPNFSVKISDAWTAAPQRSKLTTTDHAASADHSISTLSSTDTVTSAVHSASTFLVAYFGCWKMGQMFEQFTQLVQKNLEC